MYVIETIDRHGLNHFHALGQPMRTLRDQRGDTHGVHDLFDPRGTLTPEPAHPGPASVWRITETSDGRFVFESRHPDTGDWTERLTIDTLDDLNWLHGWEWDAIQTGGPTSRNGRLPVRHPATGETTTAAA